MPTPSGAISRDRLEHHERHADLVKRQRRREAADATTGDQDVWFSHELSYSTT